VTFSIYRCCLGIDRKFTMEIVKLVLTDSIYQCLGIGQDMKQTKLILGSM